jgi:transcriptional regulator with XRE-family HTH domain
MHRYMHACVTVVRIVSMTWPEYVRRVSRGDNQVAIEARTSIDQGTVSRWLRGKTTPSPAQAAKFAQSYDGNVLEAFVAAGFLTAEEAGIPPAAPQGFAAIIDADPDLSPEAKVHIKDQYGLLKAASAQSRAIRLCEQILRNGKLDEETRRQLLATIDIGVAHVQPVSEASDHADVLVPSPEQNVAMKGAVQTSQEVDRAARRATGHESDEGEPEFYADAPGSEHGA